MFKIMCCYSFIKVEYLIIFINIPKKIFFSDQLKFILNGYGEMAEWSNAPVLKTGKDASPSRVRIPVSPPLSRSPRIPPPQSLDFIILPPHEYIDPGEEKYPDLFWLLKYLFYWIFLIIHALTNKVLLYYKLFYYTIESTN